MKKILEFVLQLLFPERCILCDSVIAGNGIGICRECIDEKTLVYLKEPRCRKCGKHMETIRERVEFCEECEKINHLFDEGYPLCFYNDSVRKSIYRLKYSNRRRYADVYGRLMAERFGEKLKRLKPDALLPVPIHKKRRLQRGYNQAELLAASLGRKLGVPVLSDYIGRVKETRPMKLLNGEERQINLKNAFKILRNDVKLRNVIIIDDIYTTGATIDEMSAVLRDAGVEKIYFVTIAAGSGN